MTSPGTGGLPGSSAEDLMYFSVCYFLTAQSPNAVDSGKFAL